MRFFLLMLNVILSMSSLYASKPKPCEIVGYEQLRYVLYNEYAASSAGLTSNDVKEKGKFLKKCIREYAVCIAEAAPHATNWFNINLEEPKVKFDPVKRALIFGMLQYFDKKRGVAICAISANGFFTAVPWLGYVWAIKDNKVTKYEIYGDRFNTVMTPKSLYKALLLSYEDEIKSIEYAKHHA